MVARTAVTATSRALLRRFARQTRSTTAPLRSPIHTSAPTRSPTATAPLDDVIPGATYVHIPPLEIPAEGLVPIQGSNQLVVRIGGNVSPNLTVAHSLTIVKAVEAKCGPAVAVHHRRDPVNGTLLRTLHITLLHPVTLTKDLVLEVPCYSISRAHRMNGGPSLAEIEQAILEPPSTTQGKAPNSTKPARLDTIFVEVRTVVPKDVTSVADTYGVYRSAMPVETKPGVFTSGRGPARRSSDRRARKAPEEELQEDEEILSRLTEWKGFYGGFADLQAAYRPLTGVFSAEPSRADRSTSSPTSPSAPIKVESVSATDLAEQKKAEKQTLEERLAAEREYWRNRRELEKAKREESVDSSAAKPSSTLLKRLLKREQESPASETTSSSPSTASSSTSQSTSTTPAQDTHANPEPAAQLNAAQRRSIEKVIAQNRADASPAAKVKKLITPGPQRADTSQEQSMTTKGFTNVPREEKEAGYFQRVANWFTQK